MSTKYLADDEKFAKTDRKTFQEVWEGILPDGGYGKFSKGATYEEHTATKSSFKVTVGGVDYYGDEAKKKMREMMGMMEEEEADAASSSSGSTESASAPTASSKTEGGSPPPSYPPPAAPAPSPVKEVKSLPTK